MNLTPLTQFYALATRYPKISGTLLVTCALWCLQFYDAVWSAARIWYVSEIFTHGFFVIPGALYLMWRERHVAFAHAPTANYFALPLLLGALFLGLLGVAGDIQLFTHVAAFTSIPLIIWLTLGNGVAFTFWFPLLFMFFAIPVGEELVPFLQEITADMSVFLLKLSGIPIFRNGLYIEIPEGRFVVAEACSGVRFFIGSIVFGAVYAYISYQSWKRRLLFGLLAVAVPIFANALRVFGIIIVGHLSNMEHATGADHLVYGWVFFAVVLFLLIVFGELIREKKQPSPKEPEEPHTHWSSTSWLRPFYIVGIVLVLANAWKLHISSPVASNTKALIPDSLNVDTQDEELRHWQPQFPDAHSTLHGTLNALSINPPQLFIALYNSDGQDGELIASQNKLFRHKFWSRKSERPIQITISDDQQLSANQLILASPTGSRRLIIYWYELPAKQLANKTETKLRQAFAKLLGHAGNGAIMMMSVDYRGDDEAAKDDLSVFIQEHYNAMRSSLPF